MTDATVTQLPVPPARGGRPLVIGLLLAGAAAIVSAMWFRSNAADPIAARVPSTAETYVQVTLQPSIEQKRRAEGLAESLPGGEDAMEELIDQALTALLSDAPGGVSYEEMKAWIGDQAALVSWAATATSAPEQLLVVQASQLELAAAGVERIEAASGASARLTSGFVTIGSSDSALDAFARGVAERPLSRDRDFRAGRARVGGDGILLARVDLQALRGGGLGIAQVDQQPPEPIFEPAEPPDKPILEPTDTPDQPSEPLPGPGDPTDREPEDDLTLQPAPGERLPTRGSLVAGVQLVEGGVQLTLAEGTPFFDATLPAHTTLPLLHELAVNAHAAIGINDIASLIRQAAETASGIAEAIAGTGLDLEDGLLSWLAGDLGARVAFLGDGEIRGTLAIDASDATAMRAFVQTVRVVVGLQEDPDVQISGDDDAFTIRTPDVELAVEIDGSRLTVNAVTPGARGSITDAGALRGLPTEPAAIAGAIDLTALADFFRPSWLEAPEVRPYRDLVDQLGFEIRSDHPGHRFVVTLMFKEAQ